MILRITVCLRRPICTAKLNSGVDRAVEACFAQVQASILPGDGDYEKALAVYTYLVDSTEYAVSGMIRA